ncbi:MAG: PAS domain-containing protein [Raineya sp.]|nr:PAS domain-containing protein [Raineya sp.]MDW8296669.1 PAS domain-containing protein [Raineya sp.]
MALGDNIKRERMIPIRNRIVYNQLQRELEELKEEKLNLNQPNYDISVALENLEHFEEENELSKQVHHKTQSFEFFAHWGDILENCFLTAEFDNSWNILKANACFCDNLQIEPNEISVRSLKEFWVKEKTAEWESYWEKLLKGEKIQTIVEFLPKNASEQERIICSATLIAQIAQGKAKAILIAQNITSAVSAYKNNTTIELDIDKNLKSAKIIVKI